MFSLVMLATVFVLVVDCRMSSWTPATCWRRCIFSGLSKLFQLFLFQSAVSGAAVGLWGGGGRFCYCRYGVLLAASHFHFIKLNLILFACSVVMWYVVVIAIVVVGVVIVVAYALLLLLYCIAINVGAAYARVFVYLH